MHTEFASPLLNDFPDAATYDGGDLTLTGEEPTNFSGSIDNMSGEDITNSALESAIDLFRAEQPSNKLVILSKAQGLWLHSNHSAFKPTPAVN